MVEKEEEEEEEEVVAGRGPAGASLRKSVRWLVLVLVVGGF